MATTNLTPFSFVLQANPGDDLFTIAANYLGDATQWNRIAELNLAALGNVADPFLPVGVITTLQIPPVDAGAGNGGVFGL